MSSEKKAMDLQFQVRQNAHEYKSSVKELFSWEKEIKSKEQAMKDAPAPTIQANNVPVRSHVTKSDAKLKQTTANSATGSPGGSAASTPTEKQDFPLNTLAQLHKKANDIKDRGNNYVKQGEYDGAIEAYSEAIEVYAQDPVYFINRAWCYLRQKNYDACVEDCDGAIALDKLCVKAYYRRMQASESLGNNMEALKDCTTVLAIEPKNGDAKRSLERINERLRKIATKNGPNFSDTRADFVDILPFDKPAYKRSKLPMRRMPVVDIVSPRPSQGNQQDFSISDEEIDKIFNSVCGPFEEVKNASTQNIVTKSSLLENKEKHETKQPAVQKSSNADKCVKTLETPIETIATKNVRPTDCPKNNRAVDKDIATGAQQTKNSKNLDDKTTKAVEKTIDNAKHNTSIITKPEPQVKPAAASSMEHVPGAPSGTAQFYTTWKELSPNQKYQYLKSIDIANLCKILGAGFDSDTFSSLLRTLQDFYVPNKEPTTAAVLWEITKNDQFNILAMFMMPEEKNLVASIMDAIQKLPKCNLDLLEKIGKAYNLA